MGTKGKHSGGYSEVTAAKMATIEMPAEIICSKCRKTKTMANYSKKQLADLRFKILMYGKKNTQGAPAPPNSIRCRICTGAQVTEMTCIICDEVKELDGFAKAQRRTPDEARCISCIDRLQATEPGLEHLEGLGLDSDSDYDDDDSHNPYDDYMYGSDYGNTGRAQSPTQALTSSRLNQLDSYNGGSENYPSSATNAGTPSGFDTSSMDVSRVQSWNAWANAAGNEPDPADGGVWVTQNSSNKPLGGRVYTGYDSDGVGHSRFHAPSTTTSEHSYDASTTRSGWANARDIGKRFPKPRKSSPMAPRQSSLLSKGSLTVSKEEDEDDDDDEPFFSL